jgi:hypothetical protein
MRHFSDMIEELHAAANLFLLHIEEECGSLFLPGIEPQFLDSLSRNVAAIPTDPLCNSVPCVVMSTSMKQIKVIDLCQP